MVQIMAWLDCAKPLFEPALQYKLFSTTVYNWRNCSSMLVLNLNHVSNRGPNHCWDYHSDIQIIILVKATILNRNLRLLLVSNLQLDCGAWWPEQMESLSTLLAHRSPVDSPHRGQSRSFDVLFWSAPEQTVKQTIEALVAWDAIALIITSL